MKKWKAKHKGNWYPVLRVEDSGKPAHEEGGGNFYHLDGVDKPVHQKDLEDLDMGSAEKYDRVEVTADGKMERDHGKEDLNKEPKKDGQGSFVTFQELDERWRKLKKALDSNSAIMDITSQEADDEPEDQEDDVQDEGEDSQDTGEEAPEGGEGEDDGQEGDEQSPEIDQMMQELADEGYSNAEIMHIVHGHSVPIPTRDDHSADNEQAKGEIQRQQLEEKHALAQDHNKEAHEQERRQDEIEHEMNTNHKKRMHDVEYEKAKGEVADPEMMKEHKKKLLDIETAIEASKKDIAEFEKDHKKRMLDLEYQKAHKEANKEDPADAMKKEQMQFELQMKRMEKELELEFKKKELALKLKLTEEAAKQKHEHAQQQAEADAAVNAQVKEHQAKHKINDAKKPPPKEKVK